MIRKFLGDFLAYGISDLLIRASAFITLPIYSRALSTADYGTWNTLITGVGLLNAILALGGDSAYARYFMAAKTQDEQKTITSTWFSFLALWSSALVIICILFSAPIAEWVLKEAELAPLVILSLLAAPVGLINAMCAQALRNRFQTRQFAFWNVTGAVLSIGLSVGGVVLGWGVAGILTGVLIAALIVLPFRLWIIRDLLQPRFSLPYLRELLRYGVPLVPVSLAYWVFASSDRILLGQLADFSQVGFYAVASQLASILGFIQGALGQAWVPRAMLLYETDPASAARIFGQMLTYFLTLFGVLSVGVSAFANEIILLFTTDAYLPAATAVAPLALAFVAYASTQVTSISITLKNRTEYFSLLSWLAAVLNVGLNLLFIPQFGLLAAAWSTTAAYLFLTAAYAFVSQRLWSVQYEVSRIVKVTAFTLGFSVLPALFPELNGVTGILLKIGYCLLYFGLLCITGVITQREWTAAVDIVRSIRKGAGA